MPLPEQQHHSARPSLRTADCMQWAPGQGERESWEVVEPVLGQFLSLLMLHPLVLGVGIFLPSPG